MGKYTKINLVILLNNGTVYMNNIKKFLKAKKKSIISLALAFILMLSFNYSPIALLANLFGDKASAYKSTSVQNYYPNSSTKNETNISSGSYPSSLKDYFIGSSNNFNIQSYYNERFDELYAKHVHDFLNNANYKVGPQGTEISTWVEYKTLYAEFLDSVEKDTLLEYYNVNKESFKNNEDIKATTFREYAEYFISHEIKYTHKTGSGDGATATEKTLYPITNFIYTENSNEYRIQFYHSLANYTDPAEDLAEVPVKELKDENNNVVGTARDGIEDQSKFYEQSMSYNRFKTYVDNYIASSVAIYTYDGETQNKNVAAILAKDAPGSKSYYYKDNSFKYETDTTEKYVTEVGNTKPNVYFLRPETDSTTFKDLALSSSTVPAIDSKTLKFDNDGSIKTNLEKYPLLYRPIESGEYGYVSGYITYYKYEAIPYATLEDGNYAVYVLDENGVTADEQATYDFMYMDVITDKDDIDESLYVNIPAPNGTVGEKTYTIGLHDHYFIKILGISPTSNQSESTTGSSVTSDIDRFKNLINLFTYKDGNETRTRLYLKYKTNDNKLVYLKSQELLDKFLVDYPTYTYKDYLRVLPAGANMEEYYLIENASYANYYKSNYELYFQRDKQEYKTLTNIKYTGEYETRKVPNIPFEETKVALSTYELDGDKNKVIYTFVPAGIEPPEGLDEASDTYLNQSKLDSAVHNEFVKVPASVITANGLDDEKYDFYYRHKTTITNKVYIVVSKDKYETEKDNEVYKNLNYTVIPDKEISGVENYYNYQDYITIEKTDENYNANFKLYYKYKEQPDKDVYVQNSITGENALFVIDDSVTSSDKTTYKDGGRNFIVISTKEYESNYKFFTQVTDDDDNYNLKYTLYYKYTASEETEKVVYIYSTTSNSNYETFSETTEGYAASDYQLILPGDKNYVEGTNLYYKKIRAAEDESWYTKESHITTYSYTTNSTITLSSNSYYVISFYVYTNGVYNNADKTATSKMEASFYVEDTKGYITDAKVEKISTDGKWQKHYLYIATHPLLSSTIKLNMFMGNSTSILGSVKDTFATASGTVMFDEIKITKVNETDYNKSTIDNETVLTTAPADEEPADPQEPDPIAEEPEYVDKYGNKIVLAKKSSARVNETVKGFDGKTFEEIFNVDALKSYFETYDFKSVASKLDGYSELDKIWQIYISRDVSGQGNNYILSQYQKAYTDGKFNVSVIDEVDIFEEKEKAAKEDEEDKEDDKPVDSSKPTEKDDDVPYIKETFIEGNKILKLENTSRQLTLGLTSNYFTVNQGEYYKLTVWIYSPDEDAKATLALRSILKTASTQGYGSQILSTANVSANLKGYTSSQANEYGWIPITFFVEGNALHSQNCYLTLCADKNSTVYFDNITIQKITSAAYDTANSDSDKTTFCMTLTPSSSVLSAGVTNGYFNNVTVTNNYNGEIDYTTPRTAENWTVSKTSTGIIAGVVPTSAEYLEKRNGNGDIKNFYTEYNTPNGQPTVVPSATLKNNIYAIYAPAEVENPLNNYGGKDTATYAQKNAYMMYSSSISLSASTTYKLSFEFLKGLNFNGKLVANLYTSAVKAENLVSNISINSADIANDWDKFTFYIKTDAASSTVYIEIGIENAVGTCFFRNISNVTSTETLDEIRDNLITTDENKDSTTTDLFEKDSFEKIRFIDLSAFEFSVHGNEKLEDTNVYSSIEFSNTLADTSTFTTGETGVAVASYYTSSVTKSYTVTIDKVEYYIRGVDVDGTTVYKIYTDSNYTDELTKLNGKKVTVDGITKVIVGEEKPTEYTIVETEKTNYSYNFKNNITLNNVFIDAKELNNDYSENVLILANSYNTDYTLATAKYSTTLSKTSFYVLKFYVKTSDFEDGFGLNIDLDKSISRKWTNIDTTDAKYDDLRDENGFVCYQILISTKDNSISSFSANFSIGTEKSTGSGYAIIAGIELEKFATEKLFNEYSLNYDDVDKESNDTIIKSYFGASSTSSSNTSDTKDETKEDEDKSSLTWATFFYIFSSLLLGIVIVLALVATIIKKHPIKVVKQEQNDHDRDSSIITADAAIVKKTRKKKASKEEQNNEVEEVEIVKKDDGFV